MHEAHGAQLVAELLAQALEQHRAHLLQVKAHRGLDHAQAQLAIAQGYRLTVVGDEIACELAPHGFHALFLNAVGRARFAQDAGDELSGEVDAGIEVERLIRPPPLAQDPTAHALHSVGVFHGRERLVLAVVPDGFDRAALHGLAALGDLLVILRLLEDVGIAFVIGAGEIVRGRFAAKVAIDALAIDVELAGDVFRISVFAICHGKRNNCLPVCIAHAPLPCNSFFEPLSRWPSGRASFRPHCVPPMSTPSQPDPSKRPRSTKARNAEEMDLWDLEDEPSSTETSLPPTAPPMTGDIPPMPVPLPVESVPGHPSPAVSAELHGPDTVPPGGIPSLAPTAEEIAEITAEHEEPSVSPTMETEGADIASAPVEPHAPKRAPLVGIEKLGLALFGVLLIGGGGLVAYSVYSRLPKKAPLGSEVSYPIRGTNVEVTEVETFWREPIRSGENKDSARAEVAMIPVARITVNPSSRTGAIRFFYRDDRKQSVGDARTLIVNGGKFTETGSNVAEFAGTAGFNEMGMYAAYSTGQQEPWHLEILEGPSADAPSSEFKVIALVPIRPDRK